jgi:lysophospholipase L1-like esterase
MKCHPVLKHRGAARLPIGALLACVLLSGGLGAAGKAAAQDTAAKYHKILFLGNSITLHGPAPKIGWLGKWGMAASAEEKDYVHLVRSSLSKGTATAPEVMVKNIAEFERQHATYDVDAKLKEAFAFGADLVIVAIGENVPNLASEEAKAQFGNAMTKLLGGLKAASHPTIVVRSCFWANKAKDQILKQACEEVGGIFVDIGSLGKDQSNYARSERPYKHAGVGNHPGDKGMQAIAKAILEAINTQRAKGTGK